MLKLVTCECTTGRAKLIDGSYGSAVTSGLNGDWRPATRAINRWATQAVPNGMR